MINALFELGLSVWFPFIPNRILFDENILFNEKLLIRLLFKFADFQIFERNILLSIMDQAFVEIELTFWEFDDVLVASSCQELWQAVSCQQSLITFHGFVPGPPFLPNFG